MKKVFKLCFALISIIMTMGFAMALEIELDDSMLNFGDDEHNGTLRLEIYNEYGETKRNKDNITEQVILDNSDTVEYDKVSVTFTIEGLEAAYAQAGKTLDCNAFLMFAGKDWAWGQGSWASEGEDSNTHHGTDVQVTKDGTYTVSLDAKQARAFVEGSTTETYSGIGYTVFCIDIVDVLVPLYDIGFLEEPVSGDKIADKKEYCTDAGIRFSNVKLVFAKRPDITSDPSDVTVDEGENASFSVVAESQSGTNLSYQWQVSSDGGNTWKNSGLSGNKTNKLIVKATAARNGYMFRCLITDYYVGQTISSDVAKLTVAEQIGGTAGDLTWTLSDDGVLTISGEGEMEGYPWEDYADDIILAVIEDGVTSIGWNAFRNCSNLTSIEIPASVTSMKRAAFYDCSSLTSIIVDTKNQFYSSIDGALYNKEKTEIICVPQGKAEINIPEGVTSIGGFVFSGCNNLTSIEIPASVTNINGYSLRDCSSLTSITVDTKNQFYSSIDGALYNKEKTEIICVPAGKEKIKISEGVTRIEQSAFYDCISLTSIEIPASVTSMERNVFSYCSSLTSIAVDTENQFYSSIDGALYNKEKNLIICVPAGKEEINIPEGVTSMEDYAFSGCSSLISIEIPTSVTEIAQGAFSGCSSLTRIEIPSSVENILYGAFADCSSLTSIEIPASVTSIWDNAFYDCSSLTSVYFYTSNIPGIGEWVFSYDTLTAYYPSTWSETPTEQYGGTIIWVRVDAPAVSKQPTAVTKAENLNSVFSVAATGTDLSYQWQVSSDGGKTWKNSGLTGNKTNKLSVKATAARNGYMFRCLITDCVGQTITSDAAKLTLEEPITISTQPKKATADEGKNAVFTVSASSAAGSELSYQWQASTDVGKTWSNSGLSGNKTATLTVAATAARNGYQFRCIVSDAVGNTVTTNAATLTVKSYIKFNSQPLSQKVTNATKVKFKVSAESLTGSTLSYQWQASTDGGKTWKNSGLSGNKTAILVVDATAARSGYRFRCVVTDANGKSLTSSAAIMTVKKVADQTVTISSFTASQTALVGTSVKFNVAAKSSTGTALTYQWQASTDGGKTWKNSSLIGNKTKTLTVEATAKRNNYQFRCIVTDAENNSVTSDAAKLTVK